MRRIDYLEILELAGHILGISEENDDWEEVIEERMAETYGLGMEEFGMLVGKLVPLCAIGESPITKQMFRGFAVEEGGVGRWLARVEV